MDFDDWFKRRHTKTGLYEKSLGGDDDSLYLKYEMQKSFKAGQQSKQAEIDALKAKIEDITKWAESHIKGHNSSESDSEHDRGWFNAVRQVLKKLKGVQK